jgi:hypothetical protein
MADSVRIVKNVETTNGPEATNSITSTDRIEAASKIESTAELTKSTESTSVKYANDLDPTNSVAFINVELSNTSTCFFLQKMPLELRMLVYKHLVPDVEVVSASRREKIRQDKEPVCTALFRVSKAVHDEFADAFYGATFFEVYVTNNSSYVKRCLRTSTCFGLAALSQLISDEALLRIFPPHFTRRIQAVQLTVALKIGRPPEGHHNEQAYRRLLPAQARAACERLGETLCRVPGHLLLPLRDVRLHLWIQNLKFAFNRSGGNPSEEAERVLDVNARVHCSALLEQLRGSLRARRYVEIKCVRERNAHAVKPGIPYGNNEEREERDLLAASGEEVEDGSRGGIVRFVRACRQEIMGLV